MFPLVKHVKVETNKKEEEGRAGREREEEKRIGVEGRERESERRRVGERKGKGKRERDLVSTDVRES